MKSSTRRVLLALLVTLGSWTLVYFSLHQSHGEQRRESKELAWSLRRGDDSERLTTAQTLALEGRFVEALRRLEKPTNSGERELHNLLQQCLLFDLKWPQQLLLHCQLEASGGRPRLLARVIQSGYADQLQQVELQLLTWDGQDLKPMNLDPAEKWAEIKELKTVHLERKEESLSQLWVLGRTSKGRWRVDLYYGLRQWKHWYRLSDTLPLVQKDRVQIPGGSAWKLVDDEWIEVR